MSRHSLSICQMPQNRYFVQLRNIQNKERWVMRTDEMARARFTSKDDSIDIMALSLGWFGRVYASIKTGQGEHLSFQVDGPSSTEKVISLRSVLVDKRCREGLGAQDFLERHAIPITLGEHLWHLILQIQIWVAEWREAGGVPLGSCAFVNALFEEMEEVFTQDYEGGIPSSDMRCVEEVRGSIHSTAEKVTTSTVLEILARFASENGKSRGDVKRIREAARWTREIEKLREEGSESLVKKGSSALALEMEKGVKKLSVGEEAWIPYGVYVAENKTKSGLVRVFKIERIPDQGSKKRYTIDFGDQMGVPSLSAAEAHLDQKAFFKPLVDVQLSVSHQFEEREAAGQDEGTDPSILEQKMALSQKKHALPKNQEHERAPAIRFRKIFAHIKGPDQPFQVEPLFQPNPLKDSVIIPVLSSINSLERLAIETKSIAEFYYINQHRLRSSPEIRVILGKWVSVMASYMRKHDLKSPESLDTLEMIQGRLKCLEQEQRIGETRLRMDVEERVVPESYSDEINAPDGFRKIQRKASAAWEKDPSDQRVDARKGHRPDSLKLVSITSEEWGALHQVDEQCRQDHLLEAIDACRYYASLLEALLKELEDIGPKQDLLTKQYRGRFNQNIQFLLEALKNLDPKDFWDPDCAKELQGVIQAIFRGGDVTFQMHRTFDEQINRLEVLVQEKIRRLREELVDTLYDKRELFRVNLEKAQKALQGRLAHLKEKDQTYQRRLTQLQEWDLQVYNKLKPKIQAVEKEVAHVQEALISLSRELRDLQSEKKRNEVQLKEVEGQLSSLSWKKKRLMEGYEVTNTTRAEPTGKTLFQQESENQEAQQANQLKLTAKKKELDAKEAERKRKGQELEEANQQLDEQRAHLALVKQGSPKASDEVGGKNESQASAEEELQKNVRALERIKDKAKEGLREAECQKDLVFGQHRELEVEQRRLEGKKKRIDEAKARRQRDLEKCQNDFAFATESQGVLGGKKIELEGLIEGLTQYVAFKERSIQKEKAAIWALKGAQRAAEEEIEACRSSVVRNQGAVQGEIKKREKEIKDIERAQQNWKEFVMALEKLGPARKFHKETKQLKYPKDDANESWKESKKRQENLCLFYRTFEISPSTQVYYRYYEAFSQPLKAANGLGLHLAKKDQDFERELEGLWSNWHQELIQEKALPLWIQDQNKTCQGVTDSIGAYKGDVTAVKRYVQTWEEKTQVLNKTSFPNYKKCLKDFEEGLNGQLKALKELYHRFVEGVVEASKELTAKSYLSNLEQQGLKEAISGFNQAYQKYALSPGGQEAGGAPAQAALVTREAANELSAAGRGVIDQLRKTEQEKAQEAKKRYTSVYQKPLEKMAKKIQALESVEGIDLEWELKALFQKIPAQHLESPCSFWNHHKAFKESIKQLQALLNRYDRGKVQEMPPLLLLQKALVEAILFRMTGNLGELPQYREALHNPFLTFTTDADHQQYKQLLKLFETLEVEEIFSYAPSEDVQKAKAQQPTLATPLPLDQQTFIGAFKEALAHEWASKDLPTYPSSGNKFLDNYVFLGNAKERAEIIDRERDYGSTGSFTSEQVYELMRTNGETPEYGLQQLLAQLSHPDFLKGLQEDSETADKLMPIVFHRLFRPFHLVEYFYYPDHLESAMVSLDQGIAYACHKSYPIAAQTLLRLKGALMNFLRRKEDGYEASHRQYGTDPISLAKEFTLPKKWHPENSREFSSCYLEMCAEAFQFGFNVSRQLSRDELKPILEAWMEVKKGDFCEIPSKIDLFFKGCIWPSWEGLKDNDQVDILSDLLQKREEIHCISASEEEVRPLCTVDYPLYTFYDEARKPYTINIALGSVDVGEKPVRVLPEQVVESFPFGKDCRLFKERAIEGDKAFRFEAAVGGELRPFLALTEDSFVYYSIEHNTKHYSHIPKEQITYGTIDGLSKDLLQRGAWVEDTDPTQALCLDRRGNVLATLTLNPEQNRIQKVERIDEEKGALHLVNYDACPLYRKLKHLTPKANIKVWADEQGQVQRVDLLDPRTQFVRNLISGKLCVMDPDLEGFYIAESQGIPQGSFAKDWEGYLLLENDEGRKKLLMRQSALVRRKEWAKSKEGYYALETYVERDHAEEARALELDVPPAVVVDLIRNPKGKGTILDSMNPQANCFLALASTQSNAFVDGARYLRRLPKQFVSDKIEAHEGAILGDLFEYKREALGQFFGEKGGKQKTNSAPVSDLTESVKRHEIELPQIAAIKLIAVASALQMEGLGKDFTPLGLPEKKEVVHLLKIYYTGAMRRETYHGASERCRLTESEVYWMARHYSLAEELLPSPETLALEAPQEERVERKGLDDDVLSTLHESLVDTRQIGEGSEMMSFYVGRDLLTHFQSLYHQIDALDGNEDGDRVELRKIQGRLERLEDRDLKLRSAIIFLKTAVCAKLQGGAVAGKEGIAIKVAQELFAAHQRMIHGQYGAVKAEIVPEGRLGALYEDLLAGDRAMRTRIHQIDEKIRNLTAQPLESGATFAAFKGCAANWQKELEGALKDLEKEVVALLTQNGLYDPKVQEATVQGATPYVYYKGGVSFSWDEVAAMMKDVNTARVVEIPLKARRAMERLKVHTHYSLIGVISQKETGRRLLPEGVFSPEQFLQERLLSKNDYDILVDLENLTQLNDSTETNWGAYLTGVSGRLETLGSCSLRKALAPLKGKLIPSQERRRVKEAVSAALKKLHFQVSQPSERTEWTIEEWTRLNESRLAMRQAIQEIQQLYQGEALEGFVLSSKRQRVSQKAKRRSQEEDQTFTWKDAAAIVAQVQKDEGRLKIIPLENLQAMQRLRVTQDYSLQEVLANPKAFPLLDETYSPEAFVFKKLISQCDHERLLAVENFASCDTTSIGGQEACMQRLKEDIDSIQSKSLKKQLQQAIDASPYTEDLDQFREVVATALDRLRIEVDPPKRQPAQEGKEKEARGADNYRPSHYIREILHRHLQAHQFLQREGMAPLASRQPTDSEEPLIFDVILRKYLSDDEKKRIKDKLGKITKLDEIIQWAENPAHYHRSDFYPSLLRHIRIIQEIQVRGEQAEKEGVGLKKRCKDLEARLGVSRELKTAQPLQRGEDYLIKEMETLILREEERLDREVAGWLPSPPPLSRAQRLSRWVQRAQPEYQPVLYSIDRFKIQKTMGRAEQRLAAQKALVEGLQGEVHKGVNALPNDKSEDSQRERARRLAGEADTIDIESVWIMYAKGNLADLKEKNPCLTDEVVQEIEKMITRHHVEATKCQVMEKQMAALKKVEALNGVFQRLHSHELSNLGCVGPLNTLHEILGRYIRALTEQPRDKESLKGLEKDVSAHLAAIEDGTKFPQLEEGLKNHSQGYTLQAFADDMRSYKEAIKDCVMIGESRRYFDPDYSHWRTHAALAYEHTLGTLFRKPQIKEFVRRVGTPNIVSWLGTGFGKTFMAPGLAKMLATGENLMTILDTRDLIPTTAKTRPEESRRIYDQATHRFAFSRVQEYDEETKKGERPGETAYRLQREYYELLRCINDQGYIITSKEAVGSITLQLLSWQRRAEEEKTDEFNERIELAQSIIALFKQRGTALADEIHQILDIIEALDYSEGEQESLANYQEYYGACSTLFCSLYQDSSTPDGALPQSTQEADLLKFSENQQTKVTPQVAKGALVSLGKRIVDQASGYDLSAVEEGKEDLTLCALHDLLESCKKVLKDGARIDFQEAIKHFLVIDEEEPRKGDVLKAHQLVEDQVQTLPESSQKRIGALREILGSSVVKVLKKSVGEEICLNNDPHHTKAPGLSVCPGDKGVAQPHKELDDLFQTILIHYMYYQVEGIPPEGLQRVMTEWKEEIEADALESGVPFEEYGLYQKIKQLFEPLAVDLDKENFDDPAVIQALAMRSKGHPSVLCHFLEMAVFPQLRVFSRKIGFDAMDVASSFALFGGYSGTIQTRRSFHSSIEGREDLAIDAIAKENFEEVYTNEANKKQYVLQDSLEVISISKQLQDGKINLKEYRAIIDVGGIFRENLRDNKAIVETATDILNQFSRDALEAVVVHSAAGDLSIVRRGSKELEPFSPKMTPPEYGKRFTIYRQAYTTGTDIPQKVSAKALVTVSEKTKWASFEQGVGRLRRNKEGQTYAILYRASFLSMLEKLNSGDKFLEPCDGGNRIKVQEFTQHEENNEIKLRTYYAALSEMANILKSVLRDVLCTDHWRIYFKLFENEFFTHTIKDVAALLMLKGPICPTHGLEHYRKTLLQKIEDLIKALPDQVEPFSSNEEIIKKLEEAKTKIKGYQIPKADLLPETVQGPVEGATRENEVSKQKEAETEKSKELARQAEREVSSEAFKEPQDLSVIEPRKKPVLEKAKHCFKGLCAWEDCEADRGTLNSVVYKGKELMPFAQDPYLERAFLFFSDVSVGADYLQWRGESLESSQPYLLSPGQISAQSVFEVSYVKGRKRLFHHILLGVDGQYHAERLVREIDEILKRKDRSVEDNNRLREVLGKELSVVELNSLSLRIKTGGEYTAVCGSLPRTKTGGESTPAAKHARLKTLVQSKILSGEGPDTFSRDERAALRRQLLYSVGLTEESLREATAPVDFKGELKEQVRTLFKLYKHAVHMRNPKEDLGLTLENHPVGGIFNQVISDLSSSA